MDITRDRETVTYWTLTDQWSLDCGFCDIQAEQRVSDLNREKVELESKLEEDQEDLNEIVNKQKNTLQQVCSIAACTYSAGIVRLICNCTIAVDNRSD